MEKKNRYSKEVRERAVRLVFEQEGEYKAQWGAMGPLKKGHDTHFCNF